MSLQDQNGRTIVLRGTWDEVTVPDDQLVDYEGIELLVKYRFESYYDDSGYVEADVIVQLSQVDRLCRADHPKGMFGIDRRLLAEKLTIVTDTVSKWLVYQDAELCFESNSLMWLEGDKRMYLKQRQIGETRDVYVDELSTHQSTLRVLESLGRPIAGLRHLLQSAQRSVRSFGDYYGPKADKLQAEFRAVQKEIERIANGGPELLVDDLLGGRISHKDMWHNQQVIDEVKVWSIRSGGFVDALTREWLRDFYLERVGSVERVSEFAQIDLTLDWKNYLPDDEMQELLELAPLAITLQGKKSESEYPVTYETVEVNGERIAVGIVTIPMSVYERNVSGFPDLGHDIRLYLKLTVDGKLVANGIDDESLAKKVTGYKKGVRRGKVRSGIGVDVFGNEITPTEVPPWFVGKPPRF